MWGGWAGRLACHRVEPTAALKPFHSAPTAALGFDDLLGGPAAPPQAPAPKQAAALAGLGGALGGSSAAAAARPKMAPAPPPASKDPFADLLG